MSVRTPKMSAPKVAAHKSFRLTKPEKAKFIQSAFGSYTPESFKKTLKHADPKTASSKEQAYFLKHAKSEKTLSSRSDIEKFSEGFFEEAKETGTKLRTGFNIHRSPSEQGRRLLKEYEQKSVATSTEPKHRDRTDHMKKMTSMRERLGIQHGASRMPAAAGIQEPTPLAGAGWTGPDPKTSQAMSHVPTDNHASPGLGLQSAAFLGGRISQTGQAPTDTAVAAPNLPPGPTITFPSSGGQTDMSPTVTGQAGSGHALHLYIDGQPETPVATDTQPTSRVHFAIPVARPLLQGEHELLIVEYQGNIRIGLSPVIRFTVMPPSNIPPTVKTDLPDMSSIHELAI